MRPVISVMHPTARVRSYPSFPHGWLDSMLAWHARCQDPSRVEYVVSVHQSRWEEFWSGSIRVEFPGWGSVVVVRNEGPDTNISQVNCAAGATRGKLLMGTMDDLYPPQNWDELLIQATPDLDGEYVVHCCSGSPRDREPLINAGAMTRARYERYGYVAHPSYQSMYADDELSAVAVRDGVVVSRLDIEFEHRHPSLGRGEWDEVYAAHNHVKVCQQGEANLNKRRSQGFPA